MHDAKLAESSLTLFNEYGETYKAGIISTYVKTNSKLRMRWSCAEPMTNNSPFTHAMLHTDRRVLRISTIQPFEPGTDPKEIELEFAL